jgi:hypothetical protein
VFEKPILIFEMVKTAGLLYEAAHGGPNKLMAAMARYNEAANYDPDDFDGQDFINDWKDPAEVMAKDFLEYIYNAADIPRWLEKIEKAKA